MSRLKIDPIWTWVERMRNDKGAAQMADRHYSRQTPGARDFMPPGQAMVLVTWTGDAVFGWCRPAPWSGVRPQNGFYGWTCTIFRNEFSGRRKASSSQLILAAEYCLLSKYGVQRDGFLTYVNRSRVKSVNPGYCFKMAGWKKIGESADGQKDLLQKPIEEIIADHGPMQAPSSWAA